MVPNMQSVCNKRCYFKSEVMIDYLINDTETYD